MSGAAGSSELRRRGIIDFGGAGRPIVLLHGLMGRATTWWPVAQWLSDVGHVVGLDARAHGANAHRGPVRTEVFADDVAELIVELGAGPAVVIGHSMGGLHALVLAARRPELVHALVVEDMAPDLRGRSVDGWRAYFAGWPLPFCSLAHVREFFAGAGDYFVECVREDTDGYRLIADLDALYEIAGEWAERSFWSEVDDVRCPVLVLEAADTTMPAGQQAELARRVPGGGRHVVLAGTRHIVHHDAPGQFRREVLEFLADVDGS